MEEQLRKMEQKIRSGASSPVGGLPDAAAAASAAAEQLPPAVAAAGAAGGGNANGDVAFNGNGASAHATATAAEAVPSSPQQQQEYGDGGSVEPVVESLANGEPMNVVVEGGAGDVSVNVNRDGVVVFKFAETASGSRSGSRANSPSPQDEF